jgi:nitrate/nitrite transporter NarK
MTQFLGGYLSDRVGGDVVLPIAACLWSMTTFWTPQLAYLSLDKHTALYIVVLSRVFLGMCQGNVFRQISVNVIFTASFKVYHRIIFAMQCTIIYMNEHHLILGL